MAQRARTDPDLQGKLTGQILQIPKTCKQAPEGYPERCVLYSHRNSSLHINITIPITDSETSYVLSYEQNKTDPVLTRETLEIFYSME